MKHAVKILASMLVLALALSGCASGTDTTTAGTIVNILAAILGVTSDQATAGAGSLLGLASEKLTAQDYARVVTAIPGSAVLVKRAGEMTGLGSHFGTLANVTTALGKMGLTPVQVQSMATNLGDVAGKAGGNAVKNLLIGALK
jgi:hypothetical protein